MKRRRIWLAAVAAILWGTALAVLPGLGSAQPQQPPEATGWRVHADPRFDVSLAYPERWTAQVAFENTGGEAYLIRRRVAFYGPLAERIELDVWERDAGLTVERWFSEVEGKSSAPQSNAIVDGRAAYLLVEPGGCGVRPIVSAYVPTADKILKLHYAHTGDLYTLSVFERMLRSLSVGPAGASGPRQTDVPDLAPLLPEVCTTAQCPSSCWGGCTFAPVSQGCCGYHPVPYWQCSRVCIGDQVGDFAGNCVWWGAYARRDVGALARGNAENWAISVRNTGQLPVDRTPKVGDIVVHPGSSYNHVAYVVWVSQEGTSYKMSDMGWCADCGPEPEEAKLRTVDGDDEFIHCAGDPVIPTSDWPFSGCPFGWVPSKGFTASDLTESGWILDPSLDPYLLSPVLSISAGEAISLSIRMASLAADNHATIYFSTADSPGFNEEQSVAFFTTNDGLRRDYVVDMRVHPLWQGTITRIRLDPVVSGNTDSSSDLVTVDRIRFLSQGALPGAFKLYLPLSLRQHSDGPANLPPLTPSEPFPAHGATGQPISPTLTWVGSDPDGDPLVYDVYLDAGDDTPETVACSAVVSPTCPVGPLTEETQYYWQVLASDGRGATTVGPVWAFDTTVQTCAEAIRNGGFEADTDWELPQTAYPAVYTSEQAHTGTRSVRVGIVDPEDNKYAYSSARQLLTVPLDAPSAVLGFWLYSDGAPATGVSALSAGASPQEPAACADSRYLWVLNESGQYLATLLRPSDAERQWTYHEVDLLDYAGTPIKIQFGACNDGLGGVVAMYVDDASLQLCPP